MATRIPLPSDGSLLLRSLRLLNLSTDPEWPEVTVDTFNDPRSNSARSTSRIRAAEWILYRLFELWDPKWTNMTLRAYMPVMEPMQSVKLRSELFRALDNLRADGYITKECAVRRSTLDQCSGPKFVELLLNFATLVLKKVSTPQRRKPRVPTSTRAACATSDLEPDHVYDGLSLALSDSIRRDHDIRQEREAKMRAAESHLRERESWVKDQALARQAELKDLRQIASDENIDLERLKRELRTEFGGQSNTSLSNVNLIINGASDEDRSATIEYLSEDFWERPDEMEKLKDTTWPTLGVLADLQNLVTMQRSRMETARAFQSQVSKRNEQLTVALSPYKTPSKTPHKRTGSTSARTAQRTFNRSPSKRQPQSTPSRPQSSHLNQTKSASSSLAQIAGDTPNRQTERPLPEILDSPSIQTSNQTAPKPTPTPDSRTVLNAHISLSTGQLTPSKDLGPPLDLSSRARQSLAGYQTRGLPYASTPEEKPEDPLQKFIPEPSSVVEDSTLDRRASLADRTRLTLSSHSHDFTTKKQYPQAPSRDKRRSQERYSVNPWDNEGPTPSQQQQQQRQRQRQRSISPVKRIPDWVLAQGPVAEEEGNSMMLSGEGETSDAATLTSGTTVDEASVFQTRSRLRRSPPPFEG